MGLLRKKASLEEEMINLRITSKQMQRSAKKCEKNEKAAFQKIQKAIKQGNSEGARIYGQDAIREKNQAISHLRMASRTDACGSRIETAVRINQVAEGMQGVVKGMSNGLKSMNVEKISTVMDKFEQQFEDLDVKTQYMEGAMNATTATSTPTEQVDELIERVADENNLELGAAFSKAGPIGNKIPPLKEQEKSQAVSATGDLESRLANLNKRN